jgi:ATP synthase protein I
LVPYHNPIPEKPTSEKNDRSGASGMFGAWVQAEKLLQIAFLLPSAGFIGWLAGYGLDRWLHQTWIATAGAIFGIIAGLVGAVRMAMFYGADSQDRDGDGNSNGDGSGEAQ